MIQNMLKLSKIQLACTAFLALICASYASAFNSSFYASTSKLATGKWVKISIPEDGMYEITYEELRRMGFNNPGQVKVYGSGGHRINEVLNGSAPDDLQRIPILRTNNKICFYGNGPVAFTISNYSTVPHFTRDFNSYSQVGCYFLTEESGSDLTPATKPTVTVNNYVNTPTSLNYVIHENELATISRSGKDMLGEQFTNGEVFIDFTLPGLADSTIVVMTSIAANVNKLSYANAVIHSGGASDTTVYAVNSSRIYVPSGNSVYYNTASPYGELKLTHPSENCQFEPMLKFSSTEDLDVTMSRLDYFLLTYRHHNVIHPEDDNQLLMGYAATKGSERFMLPNASSSTVVWSIDNSNNPKVVNTKTYNDETGTGLEFFSPMANVALYVAFDPTKTLKKITKYEDVANQNLHALPVPDMLIITTKANMEQAQRLADMHAAVDGLDVAVVDHELIFNEFSSGTRDGMAYRLLCKMFYDRDAGHNKFKNLLMFGPGSFDNRELLGEHPSNLLTYESDNSNYEDFSYTTDDFYGFLDDNSGSNIAFEKLRIGVGRITCADAAEAKSDVDKIIEYYTNPDYGVWRNNTMVFSDGWDDQKYLFQGEGYKNMIDNDLYTGMHVNTVHNTMYPRSTTQPAIDVERKTATVAKHQLGNFFKDGMYFATYVGHAGPLVFTKTNNMWTIADVVGTAYPHWPIMSTACCDVAHYDNDTRGIAEYMFHKPDGGAIALLTTSRMVYADYNHQLNQYFINELFSYHNRGVMPTLGEAYMRAKLSFTVSNLNKLSFFLLGDPAMKFNYPLSRFNVTKVNGTNISDSTSIATINPLSSFDIQAQVVDANGNLDRSFNGDATATLYDKQEFFATVTGTENNVSLSRDVYFNRAKLAEVTGRVTNGVFTGTIIAPKSPLAQNEAVLLRVYAHKDNTDYMVNGSTQQVTMLPFDESQAITDNQAPIVTTMYINDETAFNNGAAVGTSAMLYITATDDQAISMQSNSIENSMTLVLDNGKVSYSDVMCYAVLSDGSKMVNIEYPLSNLGDGVHTLTYTVFDVAGNCTTRTISFIVGKAGNVELVADAMPAFKGQDVNFDIETELARTPEMIVRVTDATGNLVWMTTTESFPLNWNLTDMNGQPVPAGLYRYFGTYNDGTNYGGTPIKKLIVLDALKTAH